MESGRAFVPQRQIALNLAIIENLMNFPFDVKRDSTEYHAPIYASHDISSGRK